MNELTINLKPGSESPLYEQIYKYIKTEIQNRQIPVAEKLPSTRALARHLEVSRSTVELAYEQLLSEGYIEAVPCKGFFVARIEELFRLHQVTEAALPVVETKTPKYRYDFTPNGVDLKSFPYGVWRKLSKDILLDDRTELFRLGDPKGEAGLRSAVAGYLHQARGVHVRPEQIVIGAGNDYMILLLNAIFGRTRKIAFENPTYSRAYRLFHQLGYGTYTVNMDQSGMDAARLRALPADTAYVMPSHQYPLGIVMPIARRMELLGWAEEGEDRYIIEDDYDSEFRYKGKPIPALQGYDKQDKVIYLGTFSKAIAPAIRVSYMVLPDKLMKRFEAVSKVLSSPVSKVDQMIIQRFLEEGHFERHLNKTRALYKGRHDALLGALKPLASKCRISGENAGVHILLTFTDGQSEESLIAAAKQQDIRVYGLSEYYAKPPAEGSATVLLGYANMKEKDIVAAVDILAKIWI